MCRILSFLPYLSTYRIWPWTILCEASSSNTAARNSVMEDRLNIMRDNAKIMEDPTNDKHHKMEDRFMCL